MLKDDEIDDDDPFIDVDIDEDEIKKLPAHLNLRFNSHCNSDDLSWFIDESSKLTVGDFDTECSEVKIGTKIFREKEIIIKSSKKEEKHFSGEENVKELGIEEKSNFPAAKKLKLHQDKDVPNSKVSNIDEINLLDTKVKSGLSEKIILNKNIINDQDTNETNLVSINSCKLHNSTHLPDISGPSCSTNVSSLPGPSNCSKLLKFSNSSDTVSGEDNKLEISYLSDYFKECFLKNSIVPLAITEDVEVTLLEECEYVKFVENSMVLENDNEDVDTEEFNQWVDDPDIVDPEIVFNIDLNEHYKQMDVLVQKISETPDDLRVLDECMKLPPIPQVEHEPITFTTNERLMFMNGISMFDYTIDRDDWNKIMVKRAVILTAHAGFSIANEESLYVLADVVIDYIKKLAVVMKKNFDIQSNSSYSSYIDPINLSLQEVGVEGGIKEVMEHYKNDIFGKRDKLMNKCQHLQKVIDQYVERTQHNTRMPSQIIFNENFIEETITSEIVTENDENVPLSSIIDETEEPIVEEGNSEFQSLLEEIQYESQPIIEENIVNTELELAEPVYIDNTSDFEPQMDSNFRRVESLKNYVKVIKDRKINDTTIVDTKIMDFDLKKLLPSTTENKLTKARKHVYDCLQLVDKEKYLKQWIPSCKSSFNERKKTMKLLTPNEVKQMLAKFYPLKDVEHNSNIPINDLEKDFKKCHTSLIQNDKPSDDVGSSQTDTNAVQDIPTTI